MFEAETMSDSPEAVPGLAHIGGRIEELGIRIDVVARPASVHWSAPHAARLAALEDA
jgi:hypothetical protein